MLSTRDAVIKVAALMTALADACEVFGQDSVPQSPLYLGLECTIDEWLQILYICRSQGWVEHTTETITLLTKGREKAKQIELVLHRK